MDFSTPPYLILNFQQITVLNLPRLFLITHVPIEPHPKVIAIQAITENRVAQLVGKERLVVAGKLVAPLFLRVGSREAVLCEHRNSHKPFCVALRLVAMLLVKLPHSFLDFAPSKFLHNICSFSILCCCTPLGQYHSIIYLYGCQVVLRK